MIQLPLQRYRVAILALTLGALLKVLLVDPLIPGKETPVLLLFVAIMVSAWYGGIKAGVVTTILAAAIADYLPIFRSSDIPASPLMLLSSVLEENLPIRVLICGGLLVSWFTHALRRTQQATISDRDAPQKQTISKLTLAIAPGEDSGIPPEGVQQTESALRQAELQRLRQHLENSPLAVIEWDFNFRVLHWSQQAQSLFGWTQEEVIGKHPSEWQFVFIEDRASVNSVIAQLLAGREQRNVSQNRNYTKNGAVVHCEWYNSALVNSSGKLVSVLSFALDITPRQTVEEELRQSERRYRYLASAMPLIVFTAQRDGALDYYNQQWFDYTGMTLEQTQGWGWQRVVHPEDLQKCLDGWREAVLTGQSFETEHRFQRYDGVYRWHLARAIPIRDEQGEIVSWVGTCTDIDDRKRQEEVEHFLALASSELANSLDYQTAIAKVAHLAVPHIADWCAVDIVDEDQTIRRLAVVHVDPSKVEWAQKLHERYPPHPEDLYGVPNVIRTGQPELYPDLPDEVIVASARDAEHLEILRGVGFTSTMIVPLVARGRTLGAIAFVSAESGRHYDESDLALAVELARRAGLAVDNARLFATVEKQLANRIQAEAEKTQLIASLQESEERFRTMADSAPVLLWVAGTDALCNFFNQGWLNFTGRSLEDELGNGWVEGIHAEDLQRRLDIYMTAFNARDNFEMEYRLKRADGEYRWIVDRGTPRFGPDGSFAGYIGSCIDITERKLAEQALRDRALELARMSATLANTNTTLEKRNQELEQFAYVVSHDLKAPLRAIANLSSWIEEDMQSYLNEETQQHMNLLRGRVNRMEALIDGLLLYSRVGRVKIPVELVDVATLIADVIDSLAPPKSFTITIASPMPRLKTELLPLQQVFANLIGNAIKHHGRVDGNVTLSVGDKGQFYEFAIADDGRGIEPRYHEKVFVMFQTLEARDKVENTGVGLALVKKIVENKGGTIRLESQLGQGATFYFTWPKQS